MSKHRLVGRDEDGKYLQEEMEPGYEDNGADQVSKKAVSKVADWMDGQQVVLANGDTFTVRRRRPTWNR